MTLKEIVYLNLHIVYYCTVFSFIVCTNLSVVSCARSHIQNRCDNRSVRRKATDDISTQQHIMLVTQPAGSVLLSWIYTINLTVDSRLSSAYKSEYRIQHSTASRGIWIMGLECINGVVGEGRGMSHTTITHHTTLYRAHRGFGKLIVLKALNDSYQLVIDDSLIDDAWPRVLLSSARPGARRRTTRVCCWNFHGRVIENWYFDATVGTQTARWKRQSDLSLSRIHSHILYQSLLGSSIILVADRFVKNLNYVVGFELNLNARVEYFEECSLRLWIPPTLCSTAEQIWLLLEFSRAAPKMGVLISDVKINAKSVNLRRQGNIKWLWIAYH